VPLALQSLLSTCTDGFCLPDPIISTAGNFDPPNCVAFAGTSAQGRCLSTCLPAVAAQSSLEQSTCAAGNKCAPCADPFTGANTGACGSIGCDQSAPIPAFTFPGCCSNLGVCVPSSQLGAGVPSYVGPRDCPAGGANYQCLAQDQTPTSCHVDFAPISPFTWDSVCVPDCVLGDSAALLPQANCPANWSCPPPE